MTAEAKAGDAVAPWLQHVPVPLFAIVMGLGGLGLAWRSASDVFAVPTFIGEAMLLVAAGVFVAVTGLYAAKAIRFPAAAVGEFRHPVAVNFFPTITISLLVLAAAALPYNRTISAALWVAGAAGHLALALAILNRWITHNVEILHASPAWFIPIVGTILVPLAGVPLGHADISWFFFSVGLVFWLVLFPVVLNRIVFHDQMPRQFLPTLFILIAPPAIGFTAYLQLNGGDVDSVARTLFAVALFLAMVLATMARLFLSLSFAVGWWAFTFPSAALAGAALHCHQALATTTTAVIAGIVLAAATMIIAVVAVRTLQALLGGRLIAPPAGGPG